MFHIHSSLGGSEEVDSASSNSRPSSSCPLGLPLQEKANSVINEEGVVLRKTSKVSNKSSAESPKSSIAVADESPKIQRLAKSGLYINPSDALKFFSTQV